MVPRLSSLRCSATPEFCSNRGVSQEKLWALYLKVCKFSTRVLCSKHLQQVCINNRHRWAGKRNGFKRSMGIAVCPVLYHKALPFQSHLIDHPKTAWAQTHQQECVCIHIEMQKYRKYLYSGSRMVHLSELCIYSAGKVVFKVLTQGKPCSGIYGALQALTLLLVQ